MTPMKGSLALKQWIHNYNMFLYQKLYWRIEKNAGANLSVYARIMSICWITTNFTDSLGICFDSSLRVLDAWETIYTEIYDSDLYIIIWFIERLGTNESYHFSCYANLHINADKRYLMPTISINSATRFIRHTSQLTLHSRSLLYLNNIFYHGLSDNTG